MRQPCDLFKRQIDDESQRNPLERRRSVQQLAVNVRLDDQVVPPRGMGSQLLSNRSQAANGRRVLHAWNPRESALAGLGWVTCLSSDLVRTTDHWVTCWIRTVVRTTLILVNCPFCLEVSKTTKEHLFSQPICEAVGIDRVMDVASFDGNSGELGPIVPLHQRSVRLPREACNSGWMSDLEVHAARTIRRWISHPEKPMGRGGYETTMRWLVKTAVVLGFSEGGSRRFTQTPTDVAVPDITTAKEIRHGRVPDHVLAGAAKVGSSQYVWGTGNATVSPTGSDLLNSRAVNVTALNLGRLQLWVVVPIVKPDGLVLPKGVTQLHPRLAFQSLPTRTGDLNPSLVNATFSRATSEAFFAAIDVMSTGT